MHPALLIGYGSVGRRHLSELVRRYDSVDVVDLKFANKVPGDVPPYENVSLYSDLSQLEPPKSYSIVVIATWGPTHLSVVKLVLDFQPKFILLEKPVESSISKVNELESMIANSEIYATVNFSLRHGSLYEKLSQILQNQTLGQVCSITITAGAKCVATNGIHYLDLFMQLFGETPTSVIANLVMENINPRDSSLNFLGGLASFSFTKGKSLNFVFSNNSFAELVLEIVFEKARVVFANSKLEVYSTNNSEIFINRPKTRSVVFDSLVKSESLLNLPPFDGISLLYSKIQSSPSMFRIQDSTESTRQILRACIASSRGKRLNSIENISDEVINKDWRIS